MKDKQLEGLEVGRIKFDDKFIPLYRDLNDPLFHIDDILDLSFAFAAKGVGQVLAFCELDEFTDTYENISGPFVTELGLYNILSQSKHPSARKWRRIVHEEIINIRKQRGWDIIKQFDLWDELMDTLYFDEETGILMQSVTVAGGDVEQVVYKPERSEGLFGFNGE